MIDLVLILSISCAMQKPTCIIALLDEAWVCNIINCPLFLQLGKF